MTSDKNTFADFCSTATAHGLFYAGNPRVSAPGWRAAWLGCTALALVSAAAVVALTWGEWEADPLTTDVDIFAFQPDVRFKSYSGSLIQRERDVK